MAPVLVCVFLLALSTQSVSSLDILAADTANVDSSFTVTCSADALGVVTTPTDNYDRISAVRISWQKYGSNTPQAVAFLSGLKYVINDPKWKETTLPAGKSSWQVTYPTDADMKSSNFQRNTMKIILTVPKATCDDSGHFFCQINNLDNKPAEDKEAMNVTVGTSSFSMVVSPDYSAAGNTYQANQTVTISCAADGLEDNDFYWTRRCPDTSGNVNPSFQSNVFRPWPVENEKKEHKKETIPNNGCGAMRHSQDLVFEMTKEVDGCVVKCEFGSGSGSSTNLQGNATFFMEGGVGVTTGAPTGGSKTSSASNKDLVIGLVVGLLLVAIIVVAVLIYVCWWRKRDRSDKYKDEPDLGLDSNNSHAPPPVFYSKPNKPPKDDARGDSVSEGNPYDNEDELPPKAYYDNEGNDNNPRQQYRPRSKRRSERGSGDYYNYDDGYDKTRTRSSGDGPYASTDLSRSEDEFSESGRPRPKPKLRTKLPPKDEEEEKVLNYAELDLSRRSRDIGDDNDANQETRGRYNRNRRNRKSRGQDEEEEKPDNTTGDAGLSNKALDNSYDSRDSGHRGPPRYVNHDPVSSGPPTYNSHDDYNHPQYENPPVDVPRSREPYVGHNNTAYDGGDPEPEGRKYTRGRARSNRSERLNSSRSTEDGNSVHGLGDVGVGTAI